MPRPWYSSRARPIPRLLMPWILTPPGPQWPRYWYRGINNPDHSWEGISMPFEISLSKNDKDKYILHFLLKDNSAGKVLTFVAQWRYIALGSAMAKVMTSCLSAQATALYNEFQNYTFKIAATSQVGQSFSICSYLSLHVPIDCHTSITGLFTIMI